MITQILKLDQVRGDVMEFYFKRNGKLIIGWNSVVFISPITGNGFAGGYFWSLIAFIRLFHCLFLLEVKGDELIQ